jgi:hypothetical protein
LVITDTLNAQVPYILRYIVPQGLPNLQSLNVEQNGNPGGNFKDVEGATWWETLDGEFKTEVWKKGKRKFTKNVVEDVDWMNSVVLACPNLKELALQANEIRVSNYVRIKFVSAVVLRSSLLCHQILEKHRQVPRSSDQTTAILLPRRGGRP